MAQTDLNLGTGTNTGDGDSLRTAMSYIQSNFDELYTQKKIGSFLTAHGGGTQSYTTPGVAVDVINDGNGSFTASYPPDGVTDIYNEGVTSQFDFSELSIGDIITLAFNIDVTTSSTNQALQFFFRIGVGDPAEVDITATNEVIIKANGATTNIIGNIDILVNATVINNPAELRFISDANATLDVKSYLVKITKY